ncbi:hypothetical protein HDU76_010880, partial [Blyttiomyces sp. JEL0837]
TIAANYIFWSYNAGIGYFPGRVMSAQWYNWMNIVQGAISLGLSSYFLFAYYMPNLRA